MSDQPPPDPFRPTGPYGMPEPDGTQPAAETPGKPSVPYPTGPASGPPAQPAYAPPPPTGPDFEPYPPTSQFAPVGSPAPPPPPEMHVPYDNYVQQAPGPPPRKSNAPLIAVIIAVSLLLCGGMVTAGVLAVRNVSNKAKEVAKPITDPQLPRLPTDAPNLPTTLPSLPTDLPELPTGIPGLPDPNKELTVAYEVRGDGTADIVYFENITAAPKTVSGAKLPWKLKARVKGAYLVSVTAIRTSQDEGDISCKALVGGKAVVAKRAQGPYARVTCTKVGVGG